MTANTITAAAYRVTLDMAGIGLIAQFDVESDNLDDAKAAADGRLGDAKAGVITVYRLDADGASTPIVSRGAAFSGEWIDGSGAVGESDCRTETITGIVADTCNARPYIYAMPPEIEAVTGGWRAVIRWQPGGRAVCATPVFNNRVHALGAAQALRDQQNGII